MQQPTPAPTERGESPPAASGKGRTRDNVASAEDHPIDYPEPPKNVDSTPFYVLATLFDFLQNERSFEKRRKHLQRWFNVCFYLILALSLFLRHTLQRWRDEKGYDLYPVLRLILPHKDRERAVYGLKEKNLAKIYIKLVGLLKTDVDAIRLMNWKKPAEGQVRSTFIRPKCMLKVVTRLRRETFQPCYTRSSANDRLSFKDLFPLMN